MASGLIPGWAWTVGAFLAVLLPAVLSVWLINVGPLIGALVVALLIGYAQARDRRNRKKGSPA